MLYWALPKFICIDYKLQNQPLFIFNSQDRKKTKGLNKEVGSWNLKQIPQFHLHAIRGRIRPTTKRMTRNRNKNS